MFSEISRLLLAIKRSVCGGLYFSSGKNVSLHCSVRRDRHRCRAIVVGAFVCLPVLPNVASELAAEGVPGSSLGGIEVPQLLQVLDKNVDTIIGTDNLPLVLPQVAPALGEAPLSVEESGTEPSGNSSTEFVIEPVSERLPVTQSLVGIAASVAASAHTASEYGLQRRGSGVVLDSQGLIVTIGYLVAEAHTITVTFSNGDDAPARVIGYDDVTGIALLRAVGDRVTRPVELGKSAQVSAKQESLILGSGGATAARKVTIGAVKKFAGGWGYVVDKAIHTYPPSTEFSGSALFNERGQLLGIGSLVSIDIDIDPKVRVPGNVFVPVDQLTESLGELLTSGKRREPLAWIGLDAKKSSDGIVVGRVVKGGPAAESGISVGDKIVAVNQHSVSGMADFYEKIWAAGKPGETVHLLIIRGERYANVPVKASSQYEWMKLDTTIPQLTELDD